MAMIVTGASDEQEAVKLAKEMKLVLEKSGFELCKWKSNSQILLQHLHGENNTILDLGENMDTSVLGLKWLLTSDEFTYEVKNSALMEKCSKRAVLSKIAQLYDPIGFVAPFITKAKIFMQLLWKGKFD